MIRFFKWFFNFLVRSVVVLVPILLFAHTTFELGIAWNILQWFFWSVAAVYVAKNVRKKVTPLFMSTLAVTLVVPLFNEVRSFREQRLLKGVGAQKMRVVSHNLYFKNRQPGETVAELFEMAPSVLALQELTPTLERHLLKALPEEYRYRSLFSKRGTHGLGIVSKFPILNEKFLYNQFGYLIGQIVEVQIEDKCVQIINVHLASPAGAVENPRQFYPVYRQNYKQRIQEVQQCNEVINGFTDLQILTGDLNTPRYEPLYFDIKRMWVDAYDVAVKRKGRATFPVQKRSSLLGANALPPLITLDYVFVRGAGRVERVLSRNVGNSDHRAILSEIVL